MNSYQRELSEREKTHLLRKLPSVPAGIDFFSNDYLGFAVNNRLSERTNEICQSFHSLNGATGSRLLSGNSDFAEQVERQIAVFHETDNALVYGSGYTANLGLLSCLGKRDTTFIIDELAHASLIDGARLSRARRFKFKHNDLLDLEKKLKQADGDKLVIVESVYSMDGDTCPIGEIVAICEAFNAELIVDEAHGIVVIGKNGEGLCQEKGVHHKIMARIVTYGKAMGVHGAAVLGAQWLKEYQVNFSRSFIYSTAPSFHQFAAIQAAYELLPESSGERKSLHDLIHYFNSKKQFSGNNWLASETPIQSVIVPGNEAVLSLSEALKNVGINALAVRSPSVPSGTERIRICLHAYNTQDQIDLLFDTIQTWSKKE